MTVGHQPTSSCILGVLLFKILLFRIHLFRILLLRVFRERSPNNRILLSDVPPLPDGVHVVSPLSHGLAANANDDQRCKWTRFLRVWDPDLPSGSLTSITVPYLYVIHMAPEVQGAPGPTHTTGLWIHAESTVALNNIYTSLRARGSKPTHPPTDQFE